MKQTILIASGLTLGASAMVLARAFNPPKAVDKTVAEKNKKRNKMIGFGLLGVGLVLVGVALKLKKA